MIKVNPIEAAVAPMKADAIERAEKDARELVKTVRKELADAGHDRQKCAPYPSSMEAGYFHKLGRYELFSKLTKSREDVRGFGEANLCDVDSNMVRKFVKDARSRAAEQYDLFVQKLVGKIGAVKTATIEGNHVWSESFLTVKKPNGEVQVWKTQQIVNVSKYGLLFNQWPSRKVKQ